MRGGFWSSPWPYVIGGVAPGLGNIIANNQDGVAVQSGTDDTIRGNFISNNSGLGIDLISGETVANNGQAAPQLMGDEIESGGIMVTFELPSN